MFSSSDALSLLPYAGMVLAFALGVIAGQQR